jgi:phage shock protein A
MGDKSAFESFERMTERIEEYERKALAAAELSEDLSGDLLQQEFEALEYHGSSDQQLLELKRKMGVLGPGESDRPQLEAGDSPEIQDAEVVDEVPDEDADEEAVSKEG